MLLSIRTSTPLHCQLALATSHLSKTHTSLIEGSLETRRISLRLLLLVVPSELEHKGNGASMGSPFHRMVVGLAADTLADLTPTDMVHLMVEEDLLIMVIEWLLMATIDILATCLHGIKVITCLTISLVFPRLPTLHITMPTLDVHRRQSLVYLRALHHPKLTPIESGTTMVHLHSETIAVARHQDPGYLHDQI